MQENDYLPRVVLGQYLNWAFRYIMRNLPSHIHSVLHKISVNEVCETSDRQIEILTKTQRVLVDGVVLCTGHSNENSTVPLTTDIGFGHQPYPLKTCCANYQISTELVLKVWG
ncbi:FAD/NAD(P)-binding protein [Ochrobactrum grignonense]|nr:FAD/NAD(P)-binding protein [Brucella grignonensis]